MTGAIGVDPRRRDMKRLMLIAAVGLVAGAAAVAEPLKDGTVELKWGLYSWKQKTEVVGFGSNEENTECLIPQKASTTLTRLVDDLQKGCGVENVVQTPKGYNFRMVCGSKSKIKGKAEAVLVHTDTSMTISAKGSATVIGFIPAGFSVRADASYVGECTQEQLDKATASYYRKHPEAKPQ
jgi:hypothetical protein